MDETNEILLNSWLRLSKAIYNERIVPDLPYNESLIYNLLYRNQQKNPEKPLTATDLCKSTKILKSQMNRILNSMEQKKMIVRERSTTDKRQVLVRLEQEQIEIYQKQHEKILDIVDEIINKMGKEKARQTIEIFNLVSDIAEEVIE